MMKDGLGLADDHSSNNLGNHAWAFLYVQLFFHTLAIQQTSSKKDLFNPRLIAQINARTILD